MNENIIKASPWEYKDIFSKSSDIEDLCYIIDNNFYESNPNIHDAVARKDLLLLITVKDKTIIRQLFDKYIKCEEPYFKLSEFKNFKELKNKNYHILNNMFYFQVCDILNENKFLISQIEKTKKLSNISILLYYYHINNNEKNINYLFKYISKIDNKLLYNIKNKVEYNILTNILSIHKMLRKYNIVFLAKIIKLSKHPFFINLTTYDLSSLASRMHLNPSNSDNLYQDFMSTHDDELTISQFLKIYTGYNKSLTIYDIEKYVLLIKQNKNYSEQRNINYIFDGLKLIRHDFYVKYFETLDKYNLLSNKSTEIFMRLLIREECIYIETKEYTKRVLPIYEIFIKNNLDVELLEKSNIKYNRITSASNPLLAANLERTNTFNTLFKLLSMMQRTYKIKKVKEKIQSQKVWTI